MPEARKKTPLSLLLFVRPDYMTSRPQDTRIPTILSPPYKISYFIFVGLDILSQTLFVVKRLEPTPLLCGV